MIVRAAEHPAFADALPVRRASAAEPPHLPPADIAGSAAVSLAENIHGRGVNIRLAALVKANARQFGNRHADAVYLPDKVRVFPDRRLYPRRLMDRDV